MSEQITSADGHCELSLEDLEKGIKLVKTIPRWTRTIMIVTNIFYWCCYGSSMGKTHHFGWTQNISTFRCIFIINHDVQWMNPTEFGDPPTFPSATPRGCNSLFRVKYFNKHFLILLLFRPAQSAAWRKSDEAKQWGLRRLKMSSAEV